MTIQPNVVQIGQLIFGPDLGTGPAWVFQVIMSATLIVRGIPLKTRILYQVIYTLHQVRCPKSALESPRAKRGFYWTFSQPIRRKVVSLYEILFVSVWSDWEEIENCTVKEEYSFLGMPVWFRTLARECLNLPPKSLQNETCLENLDCEGINITGEYCPPGF